jgi:hypothetical protein
MKIISLISLLFLTSIAFGQKLKFKVNGQKDTTVHLVKYVGKGMYYADTAEIKNGMVEFNGSKQVPGIMGLLLPGQKFFEFIYNNEEVFIETALPDFAGNIKVKKSDENKIFMAYVNFITSKKTTVGQLIETRSKLKETDNQFKILSARIDSINNEVVAYQNDLMKNNPTKFVSKIVKMSIDIFVPEAPKNDQGQILDSNFRFK